MIGHREMVRSSLRTIGYEGSRIDEFLATIRLVGVDLLIDVRDVPVSRKKGFSKNAFAQLLREAGVDYLHLKGLGDPKPGRIAARAGRIEEFRQIYSTHLRSEAAQRDLTRAIKAAEGRKACLLCYERSHEDCHRKIVGEEMARIAGFQLIHIGVTQNGQTVRANGGIGNSERNERPN